MSGYNIPWVGCTSPVHLLSPPWVRYQGRIKGWLSVVVGGRYIREVTPVSRVGSGVGQLISGWTVVYVFSMGPLGSVGYVNLSFILLTTKILRFKTPPNKNTLYTNFVWKLFTEPKITSEKNSSKYWIIQSLGLPSYRLREHPVSRELLNPTMTIKRKDDSRCVYSSG